MEKFWKPILENLEKRESCYFTGGSLCVDYKTNNGASVICLHINGRARNLRNPNSFPQPKYITDIVDALYVEVKGHTNYYKRKSTIFNQKVLA